MQILEPKIIILQDTRRVKKGNLYPVKLRITFGKDQRLYTLGIDLSKEEFEVMGNPTLLKSVKDSQLKKRLQRSKLCCDTNFVKANETIDKMSKFSFGLFDKLFFQHEVSKEDVYDYYDKIIEQITKEGRVGTASNYQCSVNSIRSFSPKLQFEDITAQFLKDYERWLIDAGKSISTVGVYLRPLRAVLNSAIADGMISREGQYPFGKRQYQIPATRNVKKALTKDEIRKIYQYQPLKGTWWEKARDFFILSYLCNGINMKDILLLRKKDVDNDYLRFIRAKTINTHRTNNAPISIFISEDVKRIIKSWANPDGEKDDYLFPFLSCGLNPTEERAQIQQFTKMVNKYMGYIVKELEIDKKVTTYFARHSFATILKKSGANIELIRESLGHTSSKTTATYLDSFDDDVKEGISNMLLDFS